MVAIDSALQQCGKQNSMFVLVTFRGVDCGVAKVCEEQQVVD